jgi:hypothetical protein
MNMDGINQWFKRLAVAALFLNVLAIGIHYFILHQLERYTSFTVGLAVGPISGIRPDGIPVLDSGFQCHAIRYTSIQCPWCVKDQGRWEAFDAALRSYGCDSITLVPTSADLPRNSPASANQVSIIAVPADVAGRLDLLATPTTLVTDRQWRVVWAKAGTLGRGDQEKALSSLEKLR